MNKTVLVSIGFMVCQALSHGQAIKISAERQKLAEKASQERLAYARSPQYNPYDSSIRDIRKSVWKSIDQKAFQEAITEADKGLSLDPVDIELLMGKAAAMRELKDPSADQVRARWMALADSILVSGDGKSFGSAFKVISVDEEYSVIGLIGLENERQTLHADHGSMFDVLTVHSRKGKDTFDLYFNIDLPWSHLNSSFGAKK
jgi:hypothetical protein